MPLARRTKPKIKDRNKVRRERSLATRRKNAKEHAAHKRSKNRAKAKRRNRISRGKKK